MLKICGNFCKKSCIPSQIVQLIVRIGSVVDGAEDVDFNASAEETGRFGDANRGLQLVSGEHPDFDACIPEQLERGSHLVLQSVLDSSQTEQLQVLLQHPVHHRSHVHRSVGDRHFGCVIGLLEVLQFTRGQLPFGDDQSAQTWNGFMSLREKTSIFEHFYMKR